MGKVVATLSMSLDGFVADEHDGVGELFGWHVDVTEASERFLKVGIGSSGALICGRRLFDRTGGWGGRHPIGCPVFVVSRSLPAGWPRDESETSFYPDPIGALEAAQKVAGERTVSVSTPTLTRHYLDAGLLDEIAVSLVPVLLGEGTRLFGTPVVMPVRLGDPEVIDGRGVTHLTYAVLR